MKPTTQRFFAELKKAKGKTNLKANKVQLGLIDDIQAQLAGIHWDESLNKVYGLFFEATQEGKFVLDNTNAELDDISNKIDDLVSTLDELGMDSDSLLEPIWQEYGRIDEQVEGLKDDMNSGVLSGI